MAHDVLPNVVDVMYNAIEESELVSEETPPLPVGNGVTYGFFGLVLVLAVIGLYCSAAEDETPPPAAPTAPPSSARANQFEPEIEIPEEDMGVDLGLDTGVVGEETTVMMSTMRRAPRECTGSLDVSALRRLMVRQRPQVRSCYERRLKQNNALQGTVNVNLTIGADGRASRVSVRGSLRDNEVFTCVRRLAQLWQFPRPTGGSCAQVNVPFALTPRP